MHGRSFIENPPGGCLEGIALPAPASGNLGDVRGSDSESFREQADPLPSKP
jgi:hypothetical protein